MGRVKQVLTARRRDVRMRSTKRIPNGCAECSPRAGWLNGRSGGAVRSHGGRGHRRNSESRADGGTAPTAPPHSVTVHRRYLLNIY